MWEVETYSEIHNAELWKTQSEPNSFEVEHISENHDNLTQELIPPLNELTQCVDEVELFSPTKSFIDVELIDILDVKIFKWVVDLILTVLSIKFKTKLPKNGLVVEQKYSRHKNVINIPSI